MKNDKNKARFLIRRIANRNPRATRLFHKLRQKIWRAAFILLLAVFFTVGFFFIVNSPNNFETSENPEILAGRLGSDATEFLGPGFTEEDKANFSDDVKNKTIEARGGDFNKGGVGTINSILYNVKDFFKYVGGSIAFLYLIIAALQIVMASDDESIQKGNKNIKWSIIALLAIFVIDVIVVAFFEGGDLGRPGDSFFQAEDVIEGKELKDIENVTFIRNIATYFQEDARAIFSWIKTIGGAAAIIFIFIAGAQMIFADGNEEDIEKQKKYLMHVLSAFIALLMLDKFIFGVIYPSEDKTAEGITSPECVQFLNAVESSGGEVDLSQKPDGCDISAKEIGEGAQEYILGVVRFFESLLGGIAVFFIVSSGVQIIGSMGEEDIISKQKKTLVWALAGLAVIVLSHNLVMNFFFKVDTKTGEATAEVKQGLIDLAGVANFLTSFVGVFSLVAVLIAGIIWVVNFGNTEITEKAKKVALGGMIGIVLSISAYAIISSLASSTA